MAITSDLVWTINYTFMDYNNNTSTFTVYRDGASNATEVQGWAEGTMLTALAGMSDAAILDYSYSYGGRQTDPALRVPGANSQVERKGTFVFRDSQFGLMRLQVPSIKQSLIFPGSNLLLANDLLITAFTTAVIDTGVADVNNAVTFRNLPLIELATPPQQTTRRNSKG